MIEFQKLNITTRDIDNVDAETAIRHIPHVNRLLGTSYNYDQITEYDQILEWLSEAKIENPRGVAFSIWNHKDVIVNAKAVGGSQLISLLNSCRGIHEPRISSRPSELIQETNVWYKKHFPWIIDHSLIYINAHNNNIDPEYKYHQLEKCSSGKPFIHFEDSFEQTREIIQRLPYAIVGLVPQPWNIYKSPDSDRIVFVPNPQRRIVKKYPFLYSYMAVCNYLTNNF